MSGKLILASSSPYRRELLARLRLPFAWESPAVDEQRLANESPRSMVLRLAEAKARAIAARHPNAIIIASDQTAVIGNDILGKPGTHDKAVTQLQKISGRTVEFLTSLAVLNSVNNHLQLEVAPFAVHMRTLSSTQIENYLHLEQPYDCAGSFKSEGLGIALFEKMEGDDPNALVGLPLIRLVHMLANENIHVI
ncbi:MAG: septum formation inhibitor Maf [Gammaproteobacteria bacterium]|nr:septum formation inhibitor Maf [Gammaproteobacteria bacterium]